MAVPSSPPRQYHGFYSLKADRAFGRLVIYESLSDGVVSGAVRCTVVGTPEWIAENYNWDDAEDLGPVGKYLRAEITDAAQHAASNKIFDDIQRARDPGEAARALDRAISVCMMTMGGASYREAIRSVAHGDTLAN